MIILDILEIMNFRSPLLMPLSMQSLRNESEQFPNMPRELMEIDKFYLLIATGKINKKGTIF